MPPVLLRERRSAGKRTSPVEGLVEMCGTDRTPALVENSYLIEEDANSRRREEEIGAVNVVEAVDDRIWGIEELVKELDGITAVAIFC